MKRRRPNAENDDPARILQSQPEPQTIRVDCVANGDELTSGEGRSDFCFSQPTLLNDLLLCTQLNPTQGVTQNVFHRLVKRMTRFYATTKYDETVKRLIAVVTDLKYTHKSTDSSIVSRI